MKQSLVVALLLLCVASYAVQTHIDSLESALMEQNGEERLVTLNTLVWELRYAEGNRCSLYAQEGLNLSRQLRREDVESAIYKDLAMRAYSLSRYSEALDLATHALTLARRAGAKSQEASAHNALGLVHRMNGDLNVALEHFRSALSLWKEQSDDKNRISALGNIGAIEIMLGHYQTALQAFTETLKLLEEYEIETHKPNTLNNIGIVYEEMELRDRAFEYYQMALDSALKQNNDRIIPSILNNLANIYSYREEYEFALEVQQQNLEVLQRLGDRQAISRTLANIGVIYDSLDDLAKAEEYKLRSLEIKREIGDISGEAHTLYSLSVTCTHSKKYRDAVRYLNLALAIAQDREELHMVMKIHEGLAEVYSRMNNFEEAFESINDFYTIQDSILSVENEARIEEISAKYSSDAKQREIDALENLRLKQNIQRGVLIAILIILAVVVLLQWSLNRHRWHVNQILKAKNSKIEEQKRELEKALERLHAAAAEREAAHETIVELERKNSVLALAVTANHEINQPLMVISGNVDLLELYPDGEKRDTHLKRIRDAIAQIQSILHKLNSLRKVHFKQYSSSTAMVDLDALIEGEEETSDE